MHACRICGEPFTDSHRGNRRVHVACAQRALADYRQRCVEAREAQRITGGCACVICGRPSSVTRKRGFRLHCSVVCRIAGIRLRALVGSTGRRGRPPRQEETPEQIEQLLQQAEAFVRGQRRRLAPRDIWTRPRAS